MRLNNLQPNNSVQASNHETTKKYYVMFRIFGWSEDNILKESGVSLISTVKWSLSLKI